MKGAIKSIKLLLLTIVMIPIIVIPCIFNLAYAEESSWEPTGLLKENLTDLEVTPMGIFAGELDLSNSQQHNGIYFSANGESGNTWIKRGLAGQGVTDVYYQNNKIYATTYYSWAEKPAGLWVSSDWGQSWSHLGPNTKGKSVGVSGQNILLGTYSQGLWVSKDNGSTWNQVNLSVGEDEPIYRVEDILIIKDRVFIATYGGIKRWFSSMDNGETWEREEWLDNLIVYDLMEYNGLLYVATDYSGIIISKDFKTVFSYNEEFGGRTVLSFGRIGSSLFASVLDSATQEIEIYKSSNQGRNWVTTNIGAMVNFQEIPLMRGVFNLNSWLFALIPGKGIYRKKENFVVDKEPFLGELWENQRPNDILNKITSFYDHEYPFLGYGLFQEPSDVASKTLNFLGQEGTEPEIYYSSHNGYDFGLPYGTEIYSPADGLLSGYYCVSCGNTIVIDHPNGYRTVYMHLQSKDLKAQSWEKNIPIKEGDMIGKVGMTGNTTGPHLHFQVYKPKYGGASWEIMHPQGLIDPFGWWNQNKYDPFALFQWRDALGDHFGKASKYLWKEDITLKEVRESFVGQPLLASLDNLSVQIPSGTYDLPLVFRLTYSAPPTSPSRNIQSVNNTALKIEAFSENGEKISQFLAPITIKISLALEDIQKIKPESLAIYHFNDLTKVWEKLTSIFVEENLTIEAQTSSISNFAVFGELIDATYPQVTATYSGSLHNNWFREYPLVTLGNGGNGKIMYSLFGEFWEEYSEPFLVEQEGFAQLRYRAIGENGITSPLEVNWIRINTQNKFSKTLYVRETRLAVPAVPEPSP